MAATVACAQSGGLPGSLPGSGSGSSSVEDLIRTAIAANRIRMLDSFRDFDTLRSGFVTKEQFLRILSQTLRMNFTEEQISYLYQRYGQGGRMDYMAFCSAIDRTFNPTLMDRDPASQTIESREFLGTERTVCPLSQPEERELEALLQKMLTHYNYHGINLRTCYEDFDRHHKGVITESQFYRNFPGPADGVSVEEMHLLVKKYNDPLRAGLINYLNLHHDLEALKQRAEVSRIEQFRRPDVGGCVARPATEDPTLQEIFDKIREAVFKNGVRTTEYFKDHDKLRHGIITDTQFICGLNLAVGKEASLTQKEVQKVVEHYRIDPGRVRYKEFCNMMENAFNVPDLEKKPTQEMSRPPRGALARPFIAGEMTEDEEKRAEVILREISDRVRRRRLMMYQYFKDYDRGQGYTRIVTKSQFSRILDFLSLNVNPHDFKLLCKMFSNGKDDDINYPAFVQVVDTEFVGSKLEEMSLQDGSAPATPGTASGESGSEVGRLMTGDQVNLDDLLARIRHIVLTKRCRVSEFFQDFDPLNSGSISRSQFQRGLASLGLSKLGQHDLTEPQFDKLCLYYVNPAKTDQVLWKNFLRDIESVFTLPNLEKNPTLRVPPTDMYRVPKPGTADWQDASDDHRELVESTLDRLRRRIAQRRVLVKPVFQDFDRHNIQYVTANQFRQCLTMLQLGCSTAEMAGLEARYCDDNGFNYAKFLEDLEPREKPELIYVQRLKELRHINSKKSLPEIDPCTELESILKKIKIKVVRERIRVLDFLIDYDKLNHGRVMKTSFRRAINLGRFELATSELDILEDHYQHPQYPDHVDYRQFCEEIESCFTTNNLEKTPLLDVVQFKPPNEMESNLLEPEAEELLKTCVARIAERVHKYRMQLFPLFEDYDRVHNGTVTRNQFCRTLGELGLGSLVSDQEFQVIYKKFEVKIGGRNDVNYICFCHLVYDMANFEWTKP